MVASQFLYLTEIDVMNRLSAEGVLSRLDADGDGMVNPFEQKALDDALSDASETINFYTWMKYDPSVLVGNAWVNRRAVDFAAYVLCGLQGNPVPDSVWKKAEAAEKVLEAVCE